MSIDQIDDYGYPPIVKKIINDFLGIVISVFENEKPGVLLVGSTSRGELCWGGTKNDITLFSDIEFMIAVKSVSSDKKQMLFDKVNSLSESLVLGERFHFDYLA